MRIFIGLFFLISTTLFANMFEISIEQKNKYTFEENFFLDLNTTENHKKEVNAPTINLDLNFNDMIGAQYNTMVLEDDDKFDTTSFYIGSYESRYLTYSKGDMDINYKGGTILGQDFNTSVTTSTDCPTCERKSESTFTKYTLYDILSYEKQSFTSTLKEQYTYVYFEEGAELFDTREGPVTRTYKKEIWKLSTEDLIRKVKNDANENNEDFFYYYGGAKNLTDNFKIYGIVIASYEHHDMKESKAFDSDDNYIKVQWGGDDIDLTETEQFDNVLAKFKGFGYGYNITAQYSLNDFDFFINLYSKTLKLENYHTNVLNYEKTYNDDEVEEYKFDLGVVRNKEIIIKNKTTSFGIKYTF